MLYAQLKTFFNFNITRTLTIPLFLDELNFHNKKEQFNL